MIEKSEIVIIGGGVTGISLAYHLTKNNINCVILEKEPLLCQHASAKNAGMIRQLYRDENLTSWTERSIQSWPESVKKKCFKETGSLVIGRKMPDHHKHLFKESTFLNSKSLLPFIYTSTDGLLDPETYFNGLKTLSMETGNLKIFNNFNVIAIDKIDSCRFKISSKTGAVMYGEIIVNASGAWLNSIFGTNHELPVPAAPFARHLFVSTGWENELCEKKNLPQHGFYWDESSGWYRRDWSKTESLISACDTTPANPENYVPETNPESSIATKILSSLPDTGRGVKIGRGWHCFRTYTEDSLPIMGFDPTASGLYWLAAFGGFGMSTSFAATEDAAGEILHGDSRIDPKMSIRRFRKR